MSLGFGIVGCGMIARFHARAIREIPEARLVGCSSRHAESAEKFAAEFGCTPFRSTEDLVADPEIQIVSICTPSGAHLEPGLLAASAGKHVLVEKPLEITVERCDRLIDAFAGRGVRLATIFPSRFHGCWRALKEALTVGRFGQVALASAYVKWYRSQEYYDRGAWRGTWDLDGGGALMNQAIHTIDLLQWLMGPVQRLGAITGTLGHKRIEVEDVAAAALQFRNGSLGVIEATTCSYPGMLKKIEIHGTLGSAIVEEEQITHWQFANPQETDRSIIEQYGRRSSSGGGASDPAAIGHHGHRRLFEEFIAAIQENRPSTLEGIEGRKSVEIIRAIYEASSSGNWVELGTV